MSTRAIQIITLVAAAGTGIGVGLAPLAGAGVAGSGIAAGATAGFGAGLAAAGSVLAVGSIVGSLMQSTPSGPDVGEPRVSPEEIKKAGQVAIDDVQEKNRIRKGRLNTIRNVGGGSGILTNPILGKPALSNDTKILLGA